MVDYYLMLARAVGCPPESPAAGTDHNARGTSVRPGPVFARLGLPGYGRVVALNTGSSNGAARSWPNECFAELARQIVDRLEHHVLLTCGPNQRETARQIAASPGGGKSSRWPTRRSIWARPRPASAARG